jgi:hypothetical protein
VLGRYIAEPLPRNTAQGAPSKFGESYHFAYEVVAWQK